MVGAVGGIGIVGKVAPYGAIYVNINCPGLRKKNCRMIRLLFRSGHGSGAIGARYEEIF